MCRGNVARHCFLPEGHLQRVESVILQPPVDLDVLLQLRVSALCTKR